MIIVKNLTLILYTSKPEENESLIRLITPKIINKNKLGTFGPEKLDYQN